jgi:tetratricopeptide (TPR) repeat protein
MTRLLMAAGLIAVGLFVGGAGGCRDDSPAFKKADLGRALAERGDYDKAIADFNEAIRLDPTLVIAYEGLAQAYEATGRYPAAIDAYRTTVAKDPVRDSAYARLGCLLLATGGATPEAEKALNQAIEINQTHAGAHACLGALYLDREHYADAIRETELAVTLNPQNVQGHLTLGIALSQTGETERAKAEIQKAIDYAQGDEATVSRARLFLQSLEHPRVEGGPAPPG